MKNLSKLLAVLVMTLAGSGSAFAMMCGGGYSQTESNHTVFEHACYEFYFNNAGATISSGGVVVFDLTGTGVNLSRESSSASRNEIDVNGSDGDVDNTGTYITTTTTTDSELVAGVVDDDSCLDQSYCRVQVRGPRLVQGAAGDAMVQGDAVGTSTPAGTAGDAANDADGILGLALQASTGAIASINDRAAVWVNIDPQPTDG